MRNLRLRGFRQLSKYNIIYTRTFRTREVRKESQPKSLAQKNTTVCPATRHNTGPWKVELTVKGKFGNDLAFLYKATIVYTTHEDQSMHRI